MSLALQAGWIGVEVLDENSPPSGFSAGNNRFFHGVVKQVASGSTFSLNDKVLLAHLSESRHVTVDGKGILFMREKQIIGKIS